MGWYRDVISRGGAADGSEMRGREALLFAGICQLPFGAMAAWSISDGVHLGNCAGILMCVMGFFVLAWGACKKRFSQRFVIFYIAVSCVAIGMADIYFYQADLQAAWPAFVLAVDLILVLRLDHRLATAVVCCVVLWLLVIMVERLARFGLYDMPLTNSYELRKEIFSDAFIHCEKPPCKSHGVFVTYQLLAVMVFLVDFVATRGFARQVLKEQSAMQSTIATVEGIASLLAAYDVDTVAEMLQGTEVERQLPEAVHAALQRLEQNLRAYRPYLPDSLFDQLHCRGETLAHRKSRVAPGTVNEEVTIVFTDVRASTAIWEAAPEAMKKAMQVHNSVIRTAIDQFGGYEVKTIGDAFMVAFADACAGVNFGLMVQEDLFEVTWPAALLDVPICHSTDLWAGLSVRVGVNHGPVTLETNALTGRVDYFGHTVNVAARLEGVCSPGAVAVPADLWTQVSAACLPAAVGVEVVEDLKGVSISVGVRNVWPAALAGRQHNPLTGPVPVRSHSSAPATPQHAGRLLAHMKQASATIGTLSLCTSFSKAPASTINGSLEAIVPLLQQSRGVLVTLLGEHVFVGWNLMQAVPVHVESAVQFAQRLRRSSWANDTALGLASGAVHHGDVGTNTQRFVTAAGDTVSASLRVWCLAREVHVPCLCLLQDMPPGALQNVLHAASVFPPGTGGRLYEVHSVVADPWDSE